MSINMEEFGKLHEVVPQVHHPRTKEEDKEYRRNWMKEHRKELKTKRLNLGVLCDVGCEARLIQSVNREGKVYGIGCFQNFKTAEEKQRNYQKRRHQKGKDVEFESPNENIPVNVRQDEGYQKKYKKRLVFLGGFGMEGASICLLQAVNKDGRIIGIGHFSGEKTLEENRFQNRRRQFKGATILNKWFEGSVGHHMSKDVVVFIPKSLHQSIPHNLSTSENMDLINGKVLVWVGKQEVKNVGS